PWTSRPLSTSSSSSGLYRLLTLSGNSTSYGHEGQSVSIDRTIPSLPSGILSTLRVVRTRSPTLNLKSDTRNLLQRLVLVRRLDNHALECRDLLPFIRHDDINVSVVEDGVHLLLLQNNTSGANKVSSAFTENNPVPWFEIWRVIIHQVIQCRSSLEVRPPRARRTRS